MGSEPVPRQSAAIVVPVFRGPEDLRALGNTLRELDWPRDQVQIIVAVDGPDAATEQVAATFADDVVVLPTNQGSYAARSAALARLREDVGWVAFTDADCRVSPGWLRAHESALRSAPLSGGDIRVTLRDRPSPAEHLDKLRHLKQKQYVEIEGFAATANLAARREVVEELGFRTELRSGGDADFGVRAREAGHALVFTPDAWIEHPARQTTRELLRKVHRICGGIESNPERWGDRKVARMGPSLGAARLAYRLGYTRSPIWIARTVLLEWYANHLIVRSARKTNRRAHTA